MPRGDRSGRDGLGPMTGRGLGYCAGFSVPGYLQGGGFQGAGRGGFFGRGRGMGLGYRFGSAFGRTYGWSGPSQEKQALADHADALERELKALRDHLATLEKQGGETV